MFTVKKRNTIICTIIKRNTYAHSLMPEPEHSPLTRASSLKCMACNSQSTMDWEMLKRLLQELDITLHDKNLIMARFHQIFKHIETHFNQVQWSYNNSKLFIATASVVNPALLSIMPGVEGDSYTGFFWLVWSLQIAVSLVTAYTTFFKWDKKYFMYMVYKQRVEQEIWMYLELTGPYSIVHPLNETEVNLMHTTHQSKIKHFLLQLEKLFKKLRETDFNIETTDERESGGGGEGYSSNQPPMNIVPDTKSVLRKKLMAHKIDGLLNELKEAATVAQREGIQNQLNRLQLLQQQNHNIDIQLNSPDKDQLRVPSIASEEQIQENDNERYPR